MTVNFQFAKLPDNVNASWGQLNEKIYSLKGGVIDGVKTSPLRKELEFNIYINEDLQNSNIGIFNAVGHEIHEINSVLNLFKTRKVISGEEIRGLVISDKKYDGVFHRQAESFNMFLLELFGL